MLYRQIKSISFALSIADLGATMSADALQAVARALRACAQ